MRFVLSFVALTLIAMACADRQADEKEIRSLIQKQVNDWNEGSIENYMHGYWKSDSVLFFGRTLTRGYNQVLEKYRKSFPDKLSMGKLALKIVRVELLSSDVALVTGHFYLQREMDNPHGSFTLILKKIEGKWLITYDHSHAVMD